MRFHIAALTAVMAAILIVSVPRAQEHPEHPSDRAKEPMTIERLSKAITNYVQTDTKLKGGYFLIYDPVAKSVLSLTLERVHEDKLASLGNGVYFACADFKATDGTIYDLDVFMKGDDFEPTDISVHNAKPSTIYPT